MQKLYFLCLWMILALSIILSGCGKSYSDDDMIRRVQQYKYTIGNEKIEMLDVLDKVFEDVEWGKEEDDGERVVVRGTTKIHKEKVLCEVEFTSHASWWEFTLRMNGMEQKDDLASEYIKKKYKGENVEKIEEQFDIPPNNEECVRFFKDLLAYRCQGIDFDENEYSKRLRAYKRPCDLQKIKAKGAGAETWETDFLALVNTIPRSEDAVEVSQIDRTNMKITIRTKALDYADLRNRYKKALMEMLDEYSGSLEASKTIEEAAGRYHRKQLLDLDRNSKEFLVMYQAQHGTLEGCAPGRVELTKKANDDYARIMREMPHKIFRAFMSANDLKMDTKEIVINIDWKNETSSSREGTDAVLDGAIFTNVGEGGSPPSMNMFNAFYNTVRYKGELKVPGLEVMNQTF